MIAKRASTGRLESSHGRVTAVSLQASALSADSQAVQLSRNRYNHERSELSAYITSLEVIVSTSQKDS